MVTESEPPYTSLLFARDAENLQKLPVLKSAWPVGWPVAMQHGYGAFEDSILTVAPSSDEGKALRGIAEINDPFCGPLPRGLEILGPPRLSPFIEGPWKNAVWRGAPLRLEKPARGPWPRDTQYDISRARWANFYRMKVSLPGSRKNTGLLSIPGVLEALVVALTEKPKRAQVKWALQLMNAPLKQSNFYDTRAAKPSSQRDAEPSSQQIRRLLARVAELISQHSPE